MKHKSCTSQYTYIQGAEEKKETSVYSNETMYISPHLNPDSWGKHTGVLNGELSSILTQCTLNTIPSFCINIFSIVSNDVHPVSVQARVRCCLASNHYLKWWITSTIRLGVMKPYWVNQHISFKFTFGLSVVDKAMRDFPAVTHID